MLRLIGGLLELYCFTTVYNSAGQFDKSEFDFVWEVVLLALVTIRTFRAFVLFVLFVLNRDVLKGRDLILAAI